MQLLYDPEMSQRNEKFCAGNPGIRGKRASQQAFRI
jgi:hypothetical protein